METGTGKLRPVGFGEFGEFTCSVEVSVEHVSRALPHIHSLTGKQALATLLGSHDVMVTSPELQNSRAPSGRALRRSGRFKSEPCPKLLLGPNTADRKPALSRKRQAPALPHADERQEVMGTSRSGRMERVGRLNSRWCQWLFLYSEKRKTNVKQLWHPSLQTILTTIPKAQLRRGNANKKWKHYVTTMKSEHRRGCQCEATEPEINGLQMKSST